jgi:hypothetical protein
VPVDNFACTLRRVPEHHQYHLPAANVYYTSAGPGQAYLVAVGENGYKAGETAIVAYSRIAKILREDNLEIVQERIFGSLAVRSEVLSGRERIFQSQGLDADGSGQRAFG